MINGQAYYMPCIAKDKDYGSAHYIECLAKGGLIRFGECASGTKFHNETFPCDDHADTSGVSIWITHPTPNASVSSTLSPPTSSKKPDPVRPVENKFSDCPSREALGGCTCTGEGKDEDVSIICLNALPMFDKLLARLNLSSLFIMNVKQKRVRVDDWQGEIGESLQNFTRSFVGAAGTLYLEGFNVDQLAGIDPSLAKSVHTLMLYDTVFDGAQPSSLLAFLSQFVNLINLRVAEKLAQVNFNHWCDSQWNAVLDSFRFFPQLATIFLEGARSLIFPKDVLLANHEFRMGTVDMERVHIEPYSLKFNSTNFQNLQFFSCDTGEKLRRANDPTMQPINLSPGSNKSAVSFGLSQVNNVCRECSGNF
jgi:hypothetical protein